MKGLSIFLLLVCMGIPGQAKEPISQQLKEASPFNVSVQNYVYRLTAKLLKKTYRQLPINVFTEKKAKVVYSENFQGPKLKSFVNKWGFDPRGMNIFIPPNTLLLNYKAQVSDLAHEYVHYLQYNYLNMTTDQDMTSNIAELIAIRIQKQFE